MKIEFVRGFWLLLVGLLLPPIALAQSGPPALCKPCLFYAGDYDENDSNSAAFPDENTLAFDQVRTYGAVTIPQGHGVVLYGMLFQIQFEGLDIDPYLVYWEVRSGVSEGNGGTLIASGDGSPHLQPTGRGGNGAEYTVAVKLTPPIGLSSGTYWFNLTPQCTKFRDQECGTQQYAVSNTTHEVNNFRGAAQPAGEAFINSYGWKPPV